MMRHLYQLPIRHLSHGRFRLRSAKGKRLSSAYAQLALSCVLLLGLASCINDNYEDASDLAADGMVGVSLTIQTRAIGNITSSSTTEYVPGTEWENYIDIAGGDYRIYFFTYDPETETESGKGTSSTLIAEFKPLTIYSTDLDTYTRYTLSGELDEETVESLKNFKVVVVANWGTYPEVSVGTTTIDDICNASTAVFDAFVDNGNALMPSSSLHIPFFGLREYSGVTWKEGTMTRLNGDITLLRSVAKVEVILENTDVTFTEININNYNATGYCAPAGVYLRGDYDHNYTWTDDFVDALHLVSTDNEGKGINDPDQENHTIAMYKTTNSDGYETWVAYLPEYDNTSTSAVYSYISAKLDYQTSSEDPNTIYFANYNDGSTTAYDENGNADDRFDIYRNYLYRFYVTTSVEEEYYNLTIRVWTEKWEEMFNNEYTFDVEEEEPD